MKSAIKRSREFTAEEKRLKEIPDPVERDQKLAEWKEYSEKEIQRIAAMIAVAAVRYFMIKYSRGKIIAFDLDDAPAPVRGDAILLQTALRNVLDNAIKYSPPDTTVSIQVRQVGDKVQVEVCDQGKGLGQGPVGHLTERFRRGDNVEGVVGSGLGLTIADEVMRAHDGSLALRNLAEKGTGTCVLLVLPSA